MRPPSAISGSIFCVRRSARFSVSVKASLRRGGVRSADNARDFAHGEPPRDSDVQLHRGLRQLHWSVILAGHKLQQRFSRDGVFEC
jgi:hypothetical protein